MMEEISVRREGHVLALSYPPEDPVRTVVGTKRRYFGRNEWKQLVNPTFAKRWLADKSLRQISKTDNDQEGQHHAFTEAASANDLLLAEHSKLVDPIAPQVWRKILEPLEGERDFEGFEVGRTYAINPEAMRMFRTLVFLKHGITFRQLIFEIEKNHDQYPKLIAVHRDFYRMLTGKVPWGGLKLKFNYDHFTLMVQGLDFGLNKLNEFELAECLDEICPCAQRHSVEYLKKLRQLIKKTCSHLVSLDDRTSCFF
jgi:hypothetical protein